MLRWTYSHQIPIPDGYCKSSSQAKMVAVNNDIWIFCEKLYHDQKTAVLVFNTETNEFMHVDCPHPNDYNQSGTIYSSYEDQIYIWAATDFERCILYKLDTQTLELDVILECKSFHPSTASIAFLKSNMYLLYRSVGRPKMLRIRVINLNTKKVEDDYEIIRDGFVNVTSIMVYQEKLYLLKQVSNRRREVSLLDMEWEISSVIDYYALEGEKFEWKCGWLDGHTIMESMDKSQPCDYLETFDFETNKWRSTMVEKSRKPYCELQLSDSLILGDKIYAFTNNSVTLTESFDIRVLDLNPKLSTLCQLNLVDKLAWKTKNEVDRLVKLLPSSIRGSFPNMLFWRINENEISGALELAEEQRKRVIEEIGVMEKEGLVEARWIRAEFRKRRRR